MGKRLSRAFKKLLKWGLLAFLVATIVFMVVSTWVNQKLSTRDFGQAFDDCHKIWSARGLYGDGVAQNTIESFRAAFRQGALGVEVDVFFDTALKDYVVSHDFPYHRKQGRLLRLGEVFQALGEDHYFWLDFKNLRDLNGHQATEAVIRLTRIARSVKPRIYVEGSNPTNLSRFKKGGFQTIFDTHPEPESSFLAGPMIRAYKIAFYFGDYTVMAMSYGHHDNPVYGQRTRRRLGKIPVFIYHLPAAPDLVENLLADREVRAFLVGRDQSIDFHHRNACDDGGGEFRRR